MGIVFGVTGTAEPASALLKACAASNGLVAYEIRRVQPYIVAEVSCNLKNSSTESEKANSAFMVLAKYIGVFGEPENQQGAPMAMTAPVITEEAKPQKMAMTSPVVTTEEAMQFVLPFQYTSIEQVPQPKNSAVTLKSVPSRIVAVTKFSGWYDKKTGHQKLQLLHKALTRDALLGKEQQEVESESLRWNVAQYHPPFTLPFLRRNEIWIELDPKNSATLAELQTQYDNQQQGSAG